GMLEYALTPVWGLGLDYYYFPLRANNQVPPALISTNLSTSSLNATINFTRWIFPQTKSKFYVNGVLGFGFAEYTIDVIPTADMFPKDKKYYAISVPVTFSLEYNFSKPLAAGAKVHYRSYSKDNLEGVRHLNWDGVTNDYIAAVSLFLRLKFDAIKKDHLRNIAWDVYEPDKGLLLAQKLEKKLGDLDDKVKDIDAKIDSLTPRVEKLEKILSNDGPDTDGDGVPDVRDMDPNTPENTPVDFWGKTINYIVNTGPDGKAVGSLTDEIPSVYFDFDQIDLDNEALASIFKVAMKLKADPSLYVEIRGYCDYIGNNPYNNLLAQRRTDRVKAELVKVFVIPADHIISNGKGKIIEPRMKYRPNRRCDFFFGKI
ncbi:MAG TPA: OmpA family protein, partial [Paludibacter sp.]|nr:OmpA family protein [Paludibacter sp.]